MALRKKASLAAAGAPGWMVTFADLMSLMLTFFVLLLSMSSTDVAKYKQALMSISEAFSDPMNGYLSGKSIIGEDKGMEIPKPDVAPPPEPIEEPEPVDEKPIIEETKPDKEVIDATEHLYQKLKGEMTDEINDQAVEIQLNEDKILIRFQEIISFDVASAQLRENFLPLLDRVSQTLNGIEASILVVGHTDDVPITTARFRSNWDLSSARAASVVQRMLNVGHLLPNHVIASGRADTVPLVANDTAENRAKNRRVEIVITLHDIASSEPVSPPSFPEMPELPTEAAPVQ